MKNNKYKKVFYSKIDCLGSLCYNSYKINLCNKSQNIN